MRQFAFAAILITLALSGCGGLGGEPEIIATIPPALSSVSAKSVARDWQPDIANGGRIFAERCVDCHGARGDGLGELALAGSIKRPLDMTDWSVVASKSPLEWFDIITAGRIENLMPPWENALSEAERWDVALFTYTLAYDDALLARGERTWRDGCAGCELPLQAPPVFSDVAYGAQLNRELFGSALTEAEAFAAAAYARMRTLAVDAAGAETAPTARVEIGGRVIHGTAGGIVPADTVVRLRYGGGDSGYRIVETTIDVDGAFLFKDFPYSAAFDYAVGALYGERLFSQRVFPGQDDERIIRIYDETNDPSVVSIARVDLYIAPATLDGLGGGLTISQLLTYRNSSDRIYTSGRGFEDGREAALLIQFPAGATLLTGDAQGRYVVIENLDQLPDSVIDTLPVMPGEVHDVLLEFWLPYNEAAQFVQDFNNRIDAEVTVTLSNGLRVASDWLQKNDKVGLGAGIRAYSADLKVERAPRISFGIRGDPFSTSSDDHAVVTSESLPALLLAVVALAGAFLGGIGLMKRRIAKKGGEIDSLVAALARLEADHDQGRINHDLYHQRRRALKTKLAQLMETADA